MSANNIHVCLRGETRKISILFGWKKHLIWSYELIFGPKRCLRTCTKCTDSDSSFLCETYHLGLCSPFIHSVVSNDSVGRQWRPRSACADAQADLGLRCPYMPEDMFLAWHSTFNPVGNLIFSWPWWLSWMGVRLVIGGCGFDPCQVGIILLWRLIMKYFLRSFSPFRWC